MHPVLIAAAIAINFQLVSAPADAPKASSFPLQGYVSESDHTLVDAPLFAPPQTAGARPTAYVSFEPPISGTCGVAMWETLGGKTAVEMRHVADARQGQREFVHITLPNKGDLSQTDWRDLALDHYGITVICAVTEGPGAGPDSMVQSQFYVAPMPRLSQT